MDPNHRIDRVEDRQDQLQEAVVMMARADEKILFIMEQVKRINRENEKRDEDIRAALDQSKSAKEATKSLKKLIWTGFSTIVSVVTAVVVTLVKKYFG